MPWIESHTEIERHRKTILMAAELHIKRVHLSGHLHCLWHHILEQQEDGDLSSWPEELIAQMAEYEGDAAQFVELLKKYCWIDRKNNLIHDWLDYAGRYLTSKYRTRNPKRLKAIFKLHESVPGRSKGVRPRTDNPSGMVGKVGTLLNLNLPEWIDPTAWAAFEAMRRESGKPLTERSRLRIIAKLEVLKAAGEDPNACLNQSADNDWRGVFPANRNGKGKGKSEKQHERTQEFFEVKL